MRWARVQAAVSTAEIAKRADVAEDRVKAWESGDERPTVAKLRTVAEMLKQPMALFFAPAPPAEGIRVPPDFRAMGTTMGRALTHEIRLAEERRDIYRRLDPAAVAASPWQQWAQAPSMTAMDARELFGVSVSDIEATKTDTEALRLWITALEDQGILVFQMSRVSDAECSGFSVDDERTPVIVLNGKDSPSRRVFTLLHELGHLLHRGGGLCLLDDDVDRERACNRFAEDVLLPVEELRGTVQGLHGVDAVDSAVKRFRVSRSAAVISLYRHGLRACPVRRGFWGSSVRWPVRFRGVVPG
jgi:Zn-dependent peptidase ImmA (M78 family)/transcriptional regulator with XRE-family HTH domain